MDSITIIAPAKINLTLDVIGKRDDGYHNLKSIMQSVSLVDYVTLTKNDSSRITVSCTDINIPCNENNIVHKAAIEFFRQTETKPFGLHIHIDKNIPSEAGLGGGSADGAAVLVGLNELCGKICTINKLCHIGCNIGADVPFCIIGGTCICEGIGDKISCLKPLSKCHIVIGKGKSSISTKEAYEKIDTLNLRSKYDFDISSASMLWKDYDLSIVSKLCSNIFEECLDTDTAYEINDIKSVMLNNGAMCACMSGSGSAVYGIFNESVSADVCLNLLKEKKYFSHLCLPINYGAKICEISV